MTKRYRRRRMTRAERTAQSERLRTAWASGKFAGRQKGVRPDAWLPEHDARLRALIGTMEIAAVAAALSHEFLVPRTANAVHVRVKRLGLSRWVRGLSMRDLERVLGFDHRTIVAWWVAPGLLRGRRWHGRGPNEGWWFDESDVERFIRECGWAYDVARMQRGHRLTKIAELVARVEGWLTTSQIAEALGLCTETVRRWIREGRFPGARRRPGFGTGGNWVVPRRALTKVAA